MFGDIIRDYSVTTQADGKILVVGDMSYGDDQGFALVRYNIDGSLDVSFDAYNGIVVNLSSG